MEKIAHREVEKRRRQEMASLYASLRSLLPLEFLQKDSLENRKQGKRSTSDQLNGAVNYIKHLQRNIEDLSSKRDDLMLLSRSQGFGSRSEQDRNEILNHVVIRPCLVGLEIVFSGFQTPLSSVLQVLHEHGLCVLACISSNVNNKLIYIVQAEVNNLALLDLANLKETLTLMM